MVSTIASYRMIASDFDRSVERLGQTPLVKRETEYYLERIKSIRSIDEFIGDTRVFNYAMKAFGLEEMSYGKAFMRKVLEEGVASPKAFARQLSDQRYREFADTFNFAAFGETTTIFEATRSGTVDRYLRQTLEQQAGAGNEGVRLALYFERKAASLTSPYQILADGALTKVVQVALGLPSSTSALDIDRQAKIISDRLDLDDLKDADKLRTFIERFASLWDLSNPRAPASVPNIVVGTGQVIGFDPALLAGLQNLKRRG